VSDPDSKTKTRHDISHSISTPSRAGFHGFKRIQHLGGFDSSDSSGFNISADSIHRIQADSRSKRIQDSQFSTSSHNHIQVPYFHHLSHHTHLVITMAANGPIKVQQEILFYGSDPTTQIPAGAPGQTGRDYIDLLEKRSLASTPQWTQAEHVTQALAGLRGQGASWWDNYILGFTETTITELKASWTNWKSLFRRTYKIKHHDIDDILNASTIWFETIAKGQHAKDETCEDFAVRLLPLARDYEAIISKANTKYPRPALADAHQGLADAQAAAVGDAHKAAILTGVGVVVDKCETHYTGIDALSRIRSVMVMTAMCSGIRNDAVRLKARQLFPACTSPEVDFTGFLSQLHTYEVNATENQTASNRLHNGNGNGSGSSNGNGRNGKNNKNRRNNISALDDGQGQDFQDQDGQDLNDADVSEVAALNQQKPVDPNGKDSYKSGKLVCGYCHKLNHGFAQCRKRLGLPHPKYKGNGKGKGNNKSTSKQTNANAPVNANGSDNLTSFQLGVAEGQRLSQAQASLDTAGFSSNPNSSLYNSRAAPNTSNSGFLPGC
jgi:hypothetical protein